MSKIDKFFEMAKEMGPVEAALALGMSDEEARDVAGLVEEHVAETRGGAVKLVTLEDVAEQLKALKDKFDKLLVFMAAEERRSEAMVKAFTSLTILLEGMQRIENALAGRTLPRLEPLPVNAKVVQFPERRPNGAA
jgi:hypothetical protein